jgi:GT2 family glycosyltransferase
MIIVTYNRPNELKRNFEHLRKLKTFPREILIIDQSENDKTYDLCLKYKKIIPIIEYHHQKKPSIPMAKNLGVKKSSDYSKILLFLDDDAFIDPSYIDEIVGYYNTLDDPNGVFGFDYYRFGNVDIRKLSANIKFQISRAVRKFFFLGYVGDDIFGVTSPYGANSTLPINSPVKAEWFPGTDPSYKKEILKKIKFDENFFWWALGEDVDISYRINKKYGKLYIVPASISHVHPPHEDDFTRKVRKIYMNQINHFYLFYKLMPEMKIKFIWNIVGIVLLRTLRMLQPGKFNKRYIEWKFFLKSLAYSINNRQKIKKGDLSIPYPQNNV